MILSEKINEKIVRKEIAKIEFDYKYDVIVAGLGTAGAVACIAAARENLTTLGIDNLCCMGGIATAGSILGYYFGSPGGMYEEFDKKSLEYNGTVYTFSGGSYGAESKKYVLEHEAKEAGAMLSYESVCTGVFLDGGKVTGIRYQTPEGEKTAACKVVIDCTGNAEVCEIAGCETVIGRDLDGQTQPVSSIKGYIVDNRIKATNHDCGIIDTSNAYSLSEKIISSHADHFRTNKNSEEVSILYFAPLIGIRESRRIVGKEMPSLKNFFADKFTKQPVFYAFSDLDKHGKDNAFENEVLQDWWIAANLGAVNISVPISYGSFLPKDYDGIMAAGRCISNDRDLSSCIRMMRDMQKAGEVAATAAAIAINQNCRLEDIPYQQLKEKLTVSGCLDEANNLGYRFETPDRKSCVPITWMADEEDIRAALDSERPGVAIWSCFRLGNSIVEPLKKWINEGGTVLKKHSAIALGLIGNESCLPIIREMVRERDPFILCDCRKNNQIRGCMAIYMAGKLKDRELVDDLVDLIINPSEISRFVYRLSNVSEDESAIFNEVYFQFFTHSVKALIRIGDVYPDSREKISGAFKKASDNLENMDTSPISHIIGYAYSEYLISHSIPNVMKTAIKNWKMQ